MTGRPQKFTPAEVAEALRKARGLKSRAAKLLGCTTRLLDYYCQRYKTCRDACSEARNEILDMGEAKLWEQVAKGEGWAVCFLLKTIGRSRGYVERHEISGPDGGPMAVQWIEVVKPENA
jgi:hypothetical protein